LVAIWAKKTTVNRKMRKTGGQPGAEMFSVKQRGITAACLAVQSGVAQPVIGPAVINRVCQPQIFAAKRLATVDGEQRSHRITNDF
jgi:hypothetical protein